MQMAGCGLSPCEVAESAALEEAMVAWARPYTGYSGFALRRLRAGTDGIR